MRRMKTLCRAIAVFLNPASLMIAQRTSTAMPPHADPKNDNKLNSDSVPDAYALNGQFDRIVIFRLKYQIDLLDGIEKLVKQEGIRNAVILSAMGSVRNYCL